MAVSNAAHPTAAEGGRGVTLARTRHAVRGLLMSLARSIAIFVPVFFLATFATFLLRAMTGLNPARIRLGEDATPWRSAVSRRHSGLNRPFFAQYWSWLTGLLHGNLGRSWSTGYPVSTLISDGLQIEPRGGWSDLIIGVTFGFRAGHARSGQAHDLDRPGDHQCSVRHLGHTRVR